jgi:hypothetical protein
MSQVRDERLQRFLARHAVSEREAVLDDVRNYLGMSPEATWPSIRAVLALSQWQRASQPERAALSLDRDPPHPSYEAVIARLSAGYENRRP